MNDQHPPWWTPGMPALVSKREPMPNVEQLQTMFVRYKLQPEAAVTTTGWDLTTSQRFADQLAAEEQAAFLREESLLYNGLAPTNISLRIIEAPAEMCVPVKQDRRLTPNFKVRVDVDFRTQCAFALTLKAYVVSQQDKDSIPEWVPDDFMDPDLPPRKAITELKGTTVITHHFQGAAELDEEQAAEAEQQKQLAAQAAQALMGGDGVNWQGGNVDASVLEAVLQESARSGNVDTATASALASLIAGGGVAGGGLPEATGSVSYDFEFQAVELVRPTRMNRVYLVFACSILEQDLLFVVYNVPTVGICRAEQRLKAAAKLGLTPADIGQVGDDDVGGGGALVGGAGAGGGGGGATSSLGGGGSRLGHADGSGAAAAAAAAAAMGGLGGQQLQSRKRPASGSAWDGDQAFQAQLDAAAAAAGLLPMQLDPASLIAGLGSSTAAAAAAAAAGVLNGGGGFGLLPASALLPGGGDLASMLAADAVTAGAAGSAARGAAVPPPDSRKALQQVLLREYEAAALTRRLSALDLAALELQAGCPPASAAAAAAAAGDGSSGLALEQQSWQEFLGAFRERLKLLRLVANVWNREEPCVICGFDMDAPGASAALASQPVGTAVCCLPPEQPGALLLVVRVAGSDGDAAAAQSNGGSKSSSDGGGGGDGNASNGTVKDGMLQALLKFEDLSERRLETWLRDLGQASHVLDVYRGVRIPKAAVTGAGQHTRLRAMDPLDAYDDILI